MTRYGRIPGSDAYQPLTDISLRFLLRSMLVASEYASECLREMVPLERRREVGSPPIVPHPPTHADLAEWSAWYLMYGAWAGQLQAWSTRVYELISDEVAAGRLRADTVQAATQAFLENRLPDYLSDLHGIGMDLFADGLAAIDESIRASWDALPAKPSPTELTVQVQGYAGTIAHTDLAIENNRSQQAHVACVVEQVDGIGLAVDPAQFPLAPGQTRRVSIRVALPETPTPVSVPAGTISLAGYNDATLIVHVWATVEAASKVPELSS